MSVSSLRLDFTELVGFTLVLDIIYLTVILLRTQYASNEPGRTTCKGKSFYICVEGAHTGGEVNSLQSFCTVDAILHTNDKNGSGRVFRCFTEVKVAKPQ